MCGDIVGLKESGARAIEVGHEGWYKQQIFDNDGEGTNGYLELFQNEGRYRLSRSSRFSAKREDRTEDVAGWVIWLAPDDGRVANVVRCTNE